MHQVEFLLFSCPRIFPNSVQFRFPWGFLSVLHSFFLSKGWTHPEWAASWFALDCFNLAILTACQRWLCFKIYRIMRDLWHFSFCFPHSVNLGNKFRCAHVFFDHYTSSSVSFIMHALSQIRHRRITPTLKMIRAPLLKIDVKYAGRTSLLIYAASLSKVFSDRCVNRSNSLFSSSLSMLMSNTSKMSYRSTLECFCLSSSFKRFSGNCRMHNGPMPLRFSYCFYERFSHFHTILG